MEHQTLKCLLALFILACAANTAFSDTGHLLRFKRHEIIDGQGFGYPVFSMLVPDNWQFSGQVQWSGQLGLPQSYLTYKASSPDGRAQVQRFPEQIFHWSEHPDMVAGYRMNGAATAPPMDAESFVLQIFLPAVGLPQARIHNTTPMPALAEQQQNMQAALIQQVYLPISPLPSRPSVEAEAALIEIEFEQIHERLLVVLHRVYSAQPSMYGPVQTVSWVAEVTAYRAPAANDVTYGPAFQVMLRSAQISPRWAVDCTRLVAYCIRDMLQSQQQVFERMRQIGQTQAEISDMLMEGWQRRNDIMDGVHDRFGDYMRSSERYHDSIRGVEVEVPNLYDNVWTNGLEYAVSDNPNFDPNQTGNTTNWTRLQRAR